jgi:hypothetical protein
VDGVQRETASPITYTLLPGRHELWAQGGGDRVRFDVGAGGVISDPTGALAAVATWAGSALSVRGVQVTFDAAALSSRYLWVDGFQRSTAAAFTLALLTGRHELWVQGGGDRIAFAVGAGGAISDPTGALAGVATWNGSSLSVRGRQVTVDATGLNSRRLWVNGVQYDPAQPLPFALLPGRHNFRGDDGVVYYFGVDGNGNFVDVDNLLARGIADGFGTNRLRLL